MKRKQIVSFILALIFTLTAFAGCENPAPGQNESEPAPETEPVKLRFAGPWEDIKALEVTAKAFNDKYPNCTVEYEYIQDYYANLEKRLASGEDTIDLFISNNIQSDSPLLPYTLDLYSAEGLDLSHTFEGLLYNFEFRSESDTKQLYSVPFGAEMRGMYVNKTLLASLGIEVPQTLSELNEACRVLSENGYIPLHANPGTFAQQLMYPYICSIIANNEDYEGVYKAIDSREAGIGSLFAKPMEILYSFIENNYYNYKYVENELKLFTDTSNEAYARYFLNIGETDGTFEKIDDKGIIAFMPSTMSLESVMEKTKSDYHSEIEYEFILAPVSEEGGFAYLSPTHGIAVNKNSENAEWAIKFLDFLFEPENNELFAENYHVIPNTKDALSLISERFDIPENHICELGQVTFSYDFFSEINTCIIDVSKGNNPKYMDKDGTALYPLEHYTDELERVLTTGVTE